MAVYTHWEDAAPVCNCWGGEKGSAEVCPPVPLLAYEPVGLGA